MKNKENEVSRILYWEKILKQNVNIISVHYSKWGVRGKQWTTGFLFSLFGKKFNKGENFLNFYKFVKV